MAKKVIYVPSCHSTNLLAEQYLAEHDIYEGSVIITDEQTGGKGRLDRTWESKKGENLTLSVVLKPTFLDLDHQFYLNIFSSLAVVKTVTEVGGIKPNIKWPNDVLVNGKKISGILIKNILKGKQIATTITGIGLNVNQTEFSTAKPTSIKYISGRHYSTQEIFGILMSYLEKYYLILREKDFDKLSAEYYQNLYGVDQEITFKTDSEFVGIIRGIDRKGHLIVERDGKEVLFDINEITYITQPQ